VQSSGRHLLALINDVLDISKIEAGQMAVGRERFDLRASIHTVIQSMQPLAQKKDLSLEMKIVPQVEEISSDQRRVEQILMNLLSNAIKFTERGGVKVHCQVESDWVAIAVSDTGMGISPDQVDDIFRPFHQLDTGLARRHEGTGLGLSICSRLIDLMGGQISVESQPGVGSTFTFRLPLNREATDE
jgi:signal transduction histidine kinase